MKQNKITHLFTKAENLPKLKLILVELFIAIIRKFQAQTQGSYWLISNKDEIKVPIIIITLLSINSASLLLRLLRGILSGLKQGWKGIWKKRNNSSKGWREGKTDHFSSS